MKPLYKYKQFSLDDCSSNYLRDIFFNGELYCAKFEELNDPMESYFQYSSNVREEYVRSVLSEKSQQRICSLTTSPYNPLMWSYYADGHKGICIEIDKILESPRTRVAVKYKCDFPEMKQNTNPFDASKHILSYKSLLWKNEHEIRYLSKKETLKVHITRVFAGLRMKDSIFEKLKCFVSQQNPNIIVERIKIEDIDFQWHL